jgi:predicted dithiol-disulfide oxidoreductase (DUF899 family)
LDDLSTEVQNLGMVPLTKSYTFMNSVGDKVSLMDLFDGRKQLVLYHFMFAPENDAGCHGCSFLGDHIPLLTHLNARDTTFVCASRAPIDKIERFKKRMSWTFPWVSSGGSDFNYDFQATHDETKRPVEYNYEDRESLIKKYPSWEKPRVGEDMSGLSVFYREGTDIFHSYSTYSRGLDRLLGTNTILDMTPLGRQDHVGDVKYHDQYTPEDMRSRFE